MAPKRVVKKKYSDNTTSTSTIDIYSPFKSDTILMIVESPSKCKKISEILGAGYKVVASKGHLYEIDGLNAINKKTYEPKYTIIKNKQQTVEKLREDISIASRVILATDGDREGESIAYHICRIFGLPIETTQRVIFHEITPHAILHAVSNPTVIDMSLVNAQQSRAVLDILVGYKLSPLLWKYIPKIGEEVFSAGRCQTPALRLVYDNYLERIASSRAFEDKTVMKIEGESAPIVIKYNVHGYFFTQNFPFCLSETFDSKEQVRDFLINSASFKHIFLGFDEKKTRKESAPLPLNTSAIIQACSNQLHISPKQTMQICQTIYQNGYITYMRTDNRKYSKTFIKQAREYIEKKYGNEYLGNTDEITTDTDTEKSQTAEAHEAIRPTHIDVITLPDDYDARQKSVYRFIRNHTLESCMRDSIYDTINVSISSPIKDAKYTLDVIKPRVLGWKVITEPIERQQMQNTQYTFFVGGGIVTSPKKGAVIDFQRIETIASLNTKLVSHYTEAGLVNTLERLAIGRPSTYSMLVDVIQQRGYVKKQDVNGTIASYTEFRLERGDTIPKETVTEKEFGKEKNKLVIQPSGIMAIEFLLKYFDSFFSYDYTSKMEERLDVIAKGGEIWNAICKDTYKTLKELITPVNEVSKKHYKLDDHHEVIFSANGPVIKYTGGGGAAAEEVKFKPIKKDIVIDVIKLDRGEYKLNDLVELQNDYLGMYEDQPMYIHNGRFGIYVEWGDRKESIKNIGIPIDQITLTDVDRYLNSANSALINNKNVLRIVTPELSVRKGKYGPYIFYKTAQMSEPKFVKLTKEFRAGYMTCPAEDLLHACGVYN